MPLFKTIQFNKTTQILVWKITETYQNYLIRLQLIHKPNSAQ
jgi:hypothetical protein